MGRTLLQMATGLTGVHAPRTSPSLSIIIPVGPRDSLAPGLRAQLVQLPADVQLRVVCADDDMRSGSAIIAGIGPRCEVIRATRGRAPQQNAGAAGASGDWLWFLHADSSLSSGTIAALRKFMQRGGAEAGYLDLRFLGDGPAAMRLTEAGVWLRSHCFGLPFGDQGLLVRRNVFAAIGGFNPLLERGEDHDLVWRLRRAGMTLRPVGAILYTSARKYAHDGWCATTLGHARETLRQAWRFSRSGAAQ